MGDTNPFLKPEFTEALIKSGSIGKASGWEALEFGTHSSILRTFIKSHSYGEYIFDWGWAEAYERYGIPYYPKLTSMVPFSPVTTRRFSGNQNDAQKALKNHDAFYNEGPFSSTHFLFIEPDEIQILEDAEYTTRHSLQYHFKNPGYKSFEDFLGILKNKKAKNIRKERHFPHLVFKRYTGTSLNEEHAKRMYHFYLKTISKKNSFDYLNESFFKLIFETMKDNVLYIEVLEDNIPIAGSLFLYGSQKLYGRYWGSNKFIENLHFELCYYQGIDFCIERKLNVFEAGAQGEHKIQRGFEPVKILSAHKLKHPSFNLAVKDFILKERDSIEALRKELTTLLPFK